MAEDTVAAGLTVSYATGLADVVPAVISYLNDRAGRDLFEIDHIVVPNAGVRAWLLQQLACSVGTSRGTDGILAAYDIGYLGLVRSVSGGTPEAEDPWAIDPLTMAVLQCLPSMANCEDLCNRYNGMLRAARTIADRFDSYHAHRPQMIEAWEAGQADLCPELGDRTPNGEWMVVRSPLSTRDLWQFELWTKVRGVIGVPSPAAQMTLLTQQLVSGETHPTATRLMVVGLQSIPPRTVGLLKALSTRIPVEVVLVHPSPALCAEWGAEAQALHGTNGVLPVRPREGHAETPGDPVFVNWLQGSREAQQILGSYGIHPEFLPARNTHRREGLLFHVQASIAASPQLVSVDGAPTEKTVQIHRAHELSRQVEILHDALLHAFTEIENLQPHDIVIMCTDMATAAPLLSAGFDRDVEVSDGNGGTRSVRIPLVIADRGLRQVSDGTEILAAMLSVVSSRASKVSVLGLLGSPAVLRAHGLDADIVGLWWKIVDRTGVNWGFSGDHRQRLDADAVIGHVQTWASGLKQGLVGVMLPDAPARPETAGVVPLDDLDSSDFTAVASLAHLVGILAELEAETTRPRSVEQWADTLEKSLVSLCGSAGDILAEPTKILRDLRKAAQAVPGSAAQVVAFSEFAGLVVERAEEIPGRQPLRTGAVTATSMVPVRSVPFKVVCILGYDDGATGSGESESDDLMTRQQFVGDVDQRIDSRRAFLDAVMAAEERFIITCNGRSTKNNSPVPFVTPLAEFVDMCVRAGAPHDPQNDTWSFVFDHPRHAIGARNFVPDAVIKGQTFAHSIRGMESSLSSGVSRPVVSHPVVPVPADPIEEVGIRDLIEVVKRPHNFFRDTLGIPRWEEKPQADLALLPMEVTKLTTSRLWRRRTELVGKWNDASHSDLMTVFQQRGEVPVGTVGQNEVNELLAIFDEVTSAARQWDTSFTGGEKTAIDVVVDGVKITGELAFMHSGNRIIMASYKAPAELNTEAALALLLLECQGIHVDEAILVGWRNDAVSTKQLIWRPQPDKEGATDRLSSLVGALKAATRLPMFGFGKTAGLVMRNAPWTEVRAAFETFVADKKYETAREYRVFGSAPRFDDVLPENGPLHRAWVLRAAGLLEVQNKTSKSPIFPEINGKLLQSVAQ